MTGWLPSQCCRIAALARKIYPVYVGLPLCFASPETGRDLLVRQVLVSAFRFPLQLDRVTSQQKSLTGISSLKGRDCRLIDRRATAAEAGCLESASEWLRAGAEKSTRCPRAFRHHAERLVSLGCADRLALMASAERSTGNLCDLARGVPTRYWSVRVACDPEFFWGILFTVGVDRPVNTLGMDRVQ